MSGWQSLHCAHFRHVVRHRWLHAALEWYRSQIRNRLTLDELQFCPTSQELTREVLHRKVNGCRKQYRNRIHGPMFAWPVIGISQTHCGLRSGRYLGCRIGSLDGGTPLAAIESSEVVGRVAVGFRSGELGAPSLHERENRCVGLVSGIRGGSTVTGRGDKATVFLLSPTSLAWAIQLNLRISSGQTQGMRQEKAAMLNRRCRRTSCGG